MYQGQGQQAETSYYSSQLECHKMSGTTPWKEGLWKVKSDEDTNYVHVIRGSKAIVKGIVEALDNPDCTQSGFQGRWMSGSYGEAAEELKNLTGIAENNIELSYAFGPYGTKNYQGILSEDGKTCYAIAEDDPAKKIEEFQWLDEDSIKEISGSFEDMNERSHPYKVQPEQTIGEKGSLIFLTGVPGCGKSVTALKLAQNEGFVYYEGDCFIRMKNPYIPLDVKEPSLAHRKQPKVRGLSEEDLNAFPAAEKLFTKDLSKGDVSKQNIIIPFLQLLAQDIVSEKKRIGGDWVVAFPVPTRKMRDMIRRECNATFINLTISEDTQRTRLSRRHNKDEDGDKKVNWLASMHKAFEPVEADEKDAYELIILPGMGKDAVTEKVLFTIQEDAKKKSAKSNVSNRRQNASCVCTLI